MAQSLMSFEEGLSRLLAAAEPVLEEELIETLEAERRVLSETLYSPIALPRQDTAAMDGYAVRCADVAHLGVRLPVRQRIPAGSVGVPLEPGSAARIFTGAPLPEGADAVVMQERVEVEGEEVIFHHVPQPWESVRRAGSEIALGSEILTAGTRLSPQALGLAAAVGYATLPVRRRVRVALFSTGDELVMPGQPLGPGQIYNSNRYLLRALLKELGCLVEDYGVVPDRFEETRAALRRAADGADVVLTSGGVSVGEEDHVVAAVRQEGRLDLWKLAIKPGKPLAYGRLGAAHFLGLPGNPVSAFVTFVLFVRPFLLRLQGVREVVDPPLWVEAGFTRLKADPRREFLRARLDVRGRAVLHPDQGSAMLASLVWADGLVEVPPATPIREGDLVRYRPFARLLG